MVREASAEDAVLHAAHAGGGAGGGVFVAIQMQQSVDGVKGQLAGRGVAVLAGVTLRGGRAHDDLAVGESDDIGRAGDAHELAMHPRDHAIRNDGDLDLRKLRERKASVAALPRAIFHRDLRETPQPRERHRHRALAVFDVDFHAAETGGTLGRGVGIGVSRRSVRSVRSLRPVG